MFLNISLSDMPLFLIHLKIFKILILDRSISTDRLSGIDLIKFSINPPPVICAAECI